MEDRKNNQIIKEMYHGEENRDASSKIRGFLFQDLVAISKLLDEKTVYVIPEYIEDVFVYTEDKTAYVIQAKYYPKGDIKGKHKDIIRDLYYQYLRLEVKKYTEKGEMMNGCHIRTPCTGKSLKRKCSISVPRITRPWRCCIC